MRYSKRDADQAADAHWLGVAHWIVKTVGDPSTTGRKPTLAYVGASDLRYYVMIVAIVKAGYVASGP